MRCLKLLKQALDACTEDAEDGGVSLTPSAAISAAQPSAAQPTSKPSVTGLAEAAGASGLSQAHLWVLMLRAFPALLAGRAAEASSSGALVDLLFDASLRPIAAPCFVSAACLERRTAQIGERLIEAAVEGSPALLLTAGEGDDPDAAMAAAVAAARAAAKLVCPSLWFFTPSLFPFNSICVCMTFETNC